MQRGGSIGFGIIVSIPWIQVKFENHRSLLFGMLPGPAYLERKLLLKHNDSFLFHQKGRFPGYLFYGNYVASIHFLVIFDAKTNDYHTLSFLEITKKHIFVWKYRFLPIANHPQFHFSFVQPNQDWSRIYTLYQNSGL